MEAVGDIRSQIKVIIDGGTEVMPDDVVFNGNEMGIIMATPFTTGQVVTWAYDPAGANTLRGITGHVEADGLTNVVANTLPLYEPHPVWEDEGYEPWVDEGSEIWTE